MRDLRDTQNLPSTRRNYKRLNSQLQDLSLNGKNQTTVIAFLTNPVNIADKDGLSEQKHTSFIANS